MSSGSSTSPFDFSADQENIAPINSVKSSISRSVRSGGRPLRELDTNSQSIAGGNRKSKEILENSLIQKNR